MNALLDALFFLAAVIFSGMALRVILYLKWAQRLPPLNELAEPASSLPPCSIIFAARDEEDRVEQTVRHILAQKEVEFEVIPVDDRSRDRTSQILKSLSAEDPRVKPKRVDILPENWLGKCHACHLAAQSAAHGWLLFTDADCWLKPDVLARALHLAEREGVDHVTLTPGVAPHTVPGEAWHLIFLMTIVDWIARVNLDKPKAHLGIGAFNLVRAKTYQAFGGHEKLRLTVLDDIKLGSLVRSVGGRTRAFIGGDDVECHWGVSVRQMIRIMEKNYFAALNYRTSLGILLGVLMPLIWGAAVVGPFTGSFLGISAGVSLISTIAPAAALARRLRWPIRGALLTPLVLPALYYAILNSTITTLRRGGIHWRDTFYPLPLLRKGTVR